MGCCAGPGASWLTDGFEQVVFSLKAHGKECSFAESAGVLGSSASDCLELSLSGSLS